MDIDTYKSELSGFEEPTKQNLIDMAIWAERHALPWLLSEINGFNSGKIIRLFKPADAIRFGLQTTYADRETMPLELNFYVAQLTMLDAEARRYCDAAQGIANGSQSFNEAATVFTLHRALKSHLGMAVALFEQAGQALHQLPMMYGAWRSSSEHPFVTFKGAEQVIYGSFSGLTHIDRAPYTSIAVLRSAVEIRIRRAFGIQGYEEASNKNFIPINMTRISEQIKLHLPQINFACDFNDIMRIYRWTNFYLHGGWRDFEWVAGYALQFLRPVFGNATPTPKGGLSINGGIRMPRQVWRDIRQTFSEAAKIGQKLNAADEKDAQCVFLD